MHPDVRYYRDLPDSLEAITYRPAGGRVILVES
jgi:hypothetical protein